jgi:hypothetical protein
MPAVSLKQVYDRCMSLWPEHVGIADGRPAAGDGYFFPELSRVHSDVDERIDHASDHWGSVFTWSMFQASHNYARAAIERGETQIELRRVPIELIDAYIRKNLAEPEWEPERSEYVGLVST